MQRIRRAFERFRVEQVRRFKRWQRHPFGLPIMVFIGLAVIGIVLLTVLSETHTTTTFHPYTSYIVIIKHDGETQTVPTKEPTVGALLSKLDIYVGPHDRVEPTLNTSIVEDNFHVNIYRATPVTITDGTTTWVTDSAGATPRAVVQEAGVPLYPEDEVTAAPATDLVSQETLGTYITITRAVPITLNNYGVELPLRTHAATVEALLTDLNIKLRSADTVIPAASTPITPGLEVFINSKGTKIVTQVSTIAMPVQTVQDNSLSFGTTAVRQQGSAGTQVSTYEVNGAGQQTLLQTVVTVPPVPEIVAQGQAVSIPANTEVVMAEAGISSSDYAYVNYIVSHESGWCPTKVQGEIGTCPGYAPASVPSYLGYGLGQATPGSKMAAFGSDWETNPVTQLEWATSYADARYGSWAAAYNHWSTYHNW
jgi:uncharacterized protein YabE (DUF348 family)